MLKEDIINQKVVQRSIIKDKCREVDDKVTIWTEKHRTILELLIKDLLRILKYLMIHLL